MRSIFFVVASIMTLVSIEAKTSKEKGNEDDGTIVQKKYKFLQENNGVRIEAEYGQNTKKKGKRAREKISWELMPGDGFQVENTYKNHDDKTKTKVDTFFRYQILTLVEFKKDDVTSDDEAFDQQEVVAEYQLKSWKETVFDSDCSLEKHCKATFTTTDDCFSVVAYSNFADIITDRRLSLDPDDLKLDYIFSGDCGVSSNDNALALIGKVQTATKTKTKPSKREKKGPKLDGLASEEYDGVSMYLTWLGEVDCGADLQTTRAVSVHTTEATDGKGKKNDKDILVSWAIHQKLNDTNCTWDPVVGVGVSSAHTNTFAYTFVTTGIIAMIVGLI